MIIVVTTMLIATKTKKNLYPMFAMAVAAGVVKAMELQKELSRAIVAP